MAVSGAEKTRIGASISGVGIKVSISAKAESMGWTGKNTTQTPSYVNKDTSQTPSYTEDTG